MNEPLTFRPMRRDVVTVMRGARVAGTIRLHRRLGGCLVSVPGVLTATSNPGHATFATVAEAKAALVALDTAADPGAAISRWVARARAAGRSPDRVLA